MKRPCILLHDHQVDLLRHRLGHARANLLIHDAGHGGSATRGVIEREAGLSLKPRDKEADRVLYAVHRINGAEWVGAELQLRSHLPDAIKVAMAGRRLGDVIAGAGADDHVIRVAVDRQKGTRLLIATTLVDARRMPIPTAARLAGPARRAARFVRESWIDAFLDKSKQTHPGITTMILQVLLFLLIVAGATVTLGIVPSRTGPPGGLAAGITAPMWLWLASGMATSIVMDTRRILKRRRGA